jgi:hypothetical protein
VGERPAGRAECGRLDDRASDRFGVGAWRSFDSSELRGPVDWSGEASKEPTKFIVGLPGAESPWPARAAPESSPAASAAADAVNAAFPKGRKGELDTDMKPRADVAVAADRLPGPRSGRPTCSGKSCRSQSSLFVMDRRC